MADGVDVLGPEGSELPQAAAAASAATVNAPRIRTANMQSPINDVGGATTSTKSRELPLVHAWAGCTLPYPTPKKSCPRPVPLTLRRVTPETDRRPIRPRSGTTRERFRH